MSSFVRTFSVLLGVLVVVSCAGSRSSFPIFTTDGGGFHHASYDYSVAALPGTDDVMSREWRLDNYAPSADGSALGEPKEGDAYEVEVGLDYDGDGDFEGTVTLPRFDLKFNHRRNDARLFVITVPISQYDSERELAVILRDLVAHSSNGGGISYDFSRGTARASGERAAQILVSREVTVGGYPAHEVIFEVANVPELELTPDARGVRSHLVLVRPGFVFAREQMVRSARMPSLGGRTVGQTTCFPGLMLIGYANHPDDYDAQQPEFRDFLNRVRIGAEWPLEALEAVRAECNISALDVVTTGGQVLYSSVARQSEEGRCASDGLVAIQMEESPWRRTFHVQHPLLQAPGGATTAGQPFSAASADTTAGAEQTAGGEQTEVLSGGAW